MGAGQLLSCLLHRELPFDARAGRIALALPCCNSNSLTISVFSGKDRRRSRWDNDLGWRIMLACGSLSVNRLAVAGAVGDDTGDPSFHRRKQGRNLCDVAGIFVCQPVSHDLTRFGVDSQMQLAPPPWIAAMLFGIPLSLTEDLQAGAVQHGVNGPTMANSTRLASGEAAAAPAQSRMVGDGDLQSEQTQDRAGEAFDLAQRQMEDELQCQHAARQSR
jgi:hypothetical protein